MPVKVLSGLYEGAGVGFNLYSGFTFTGLSVTSTGTVLGAHGTNAAPAPGPGSANGGNAYDGIIDNDATVPIINNGSVGGGVGGNGGTPANSGVVEGSNGATGGYGIRLLSGGYVQNFGTITGGAGGASGGAVALAGPGQTGIDFSGVGSVTNAGLIIGGGGGLGGGSTTGSGSGVAGAGRSGAWGVAMTATGSVFNSGSIFGGVGGAGGQGTIGAGGAGGAGNNGLELQGVTTVNNSAILAGGTGGAGGKGQTTGGAGGEGGYGAVFLSGFVISNTGTIMGGAGGGGGAGTTAGVAGRAGTGVELFGGGSVINGLSFETNALITGFMGVNTGSSSAVTVTNYGTIQGSGGDAVAFHNTGDRLIDEAGSVLLGGVAGGGGRLELAGTGGTISGIGGAISGFGFYSVDTGATWTMTGYDTITSQTLTNDGSLKLSGSLVNKGSVTGAGAYALNVELGARLTNDAGAQIAGNGVSTAGLAINYGTIVSSYRSVDLAATGVLNNHATGVIESPVAVYAAGAAFVSNDGYISGSSVGAFFSSGGFLTNSHLAQIQGGIIGVAGHHLTATNYGVISSSGANYQDGGLEVNGGTITNAAAGTITGYNGVRAEAFTLTNAGLLSGFTEAGLYVFGYTALVTNQATGTITGGHYGVLSNGEATIVNHGSISGTVDSVLFDASGCRLIVDSGAVFTGAANGDGGTLELNEGGGTITGLGGTGKLSGGANLTFSNFGTIQLDGGQTWTVAGVTGPITIVDYGTVQGTGGVGVNFVSAADRLVLEDNSVATGTIHGGGGTLELAINGGTINGLGGVGALSNGGSALFTGFGVYAVDAGASLTLTGSQTLSSGQALTNAGTLNVGGTLIDKGAIANSLGALVTIDNGWTLQVQGAVANAGTIAVDSAGAVTDLRILTAGATFSGGGTVNLSGPHARIVGASTSATLTIIDNTLVGAGNIGNKELVLINEAGGVIDATGALNIATTGVSLANSGLMEAVSGGLLTLDSPVIDQGGGGTILAAGGRVDLENADIEGGTIASTGIGYVRVFSGNCMLDGSTSPVAVTGHLQVVSHTTLMLRGTIADSNQIDLLSGEVVIAAAGATLSGGGSVILSNAIANVITGATSAATLTNVDNHIRGSGLLGNKSLTLINEAAGVISNPDATLLTLDTGTNTITNAGTIAATALGGGVDVKSAVNNTGLLIAQSRGTLTLEGTVSGAGSARITTSGRLVVEKGFAENVAFVGGTGVLQLDDSVAYTGKVSGLVSAGTDSLDLRDITFTKGVTKATFSGTTGGGTLTVTDGTHTAHIKLLGNYLGATFTPSSDKHGGTSIIDPAASPATLAPLTQAMAGLLTGPPTSVTAMPVGHAADLRLFAAQS
ncbi:MAG TPA: hypothetical protein VGH15_08615 [Caulobacteraceae bacterium]